MIHAPIERQTSRPRDLVRYGVGWPGPVRPDMWMIRNICAGLEAHISENVERGE